LALRTFLLTLAVVDDLLAITIIAMADARSDPRIAVECTHPNADRIGVVWVAAEERRTAVTEPFLATAVRFPHTKPVVASDHPKRAGRRVGIRRGCRAAATWQRSQWQ
jgi:hypothetical protein